MFEENFRFMPFLIERMLFCSFLLYGRKEFSLSTEWHEAIVSVTIAAAWMFSLIGGWLTGMLEQYESKFD
jgi:hypothetical protein